MKHNYSKNFLVLLKRSFYSISVDMEDREEVAMEEAATEEVAVDQLQNILKFSKKI